MWAEVTHLSEPLHVVGAAIIEGNRCLVARRGPEMALAGYWEFPGGKVGLGESPETALRREIHEEMGVEIEVGSWIGRGSAMVGDREITLDVSSSIIVAGELRPKEHSETRWILSEDLMTLDWPEADRPVLPKLQRILSVADADIPYREESPGSVTTRRQGE